MEGGTSFSRFEPSPLSSRQAVRRSETFGEALRRQLPRSAGKSRVTRVSVSFELSSADNLHRADPCDIKGTAVVPRRIR
jgi:hypothetical protein